MTIDDGWVTGPDSEAQMRKAMKDKDKDDYEVGYGKPPVAGRWKRGQCGNPKGRPRKAERSNTERQAMRDLSDAFNREVPITIDGKKTKMPFAKAIIHQAIVKAANGDIRFLREVMQWLDRLVETTRRLNPRIVASLEGAEREISENLQEEGSELAAQLNKLKRRTRTF